MDNPPSAAEVDAHMISVAKGCLKPVVSTPGREGYDSKKTHAAAVVLLGSKDARMGRVKDMTSKTEETLEYLKSVEKRSAQALDALLAQEAKFSAEAKKIAGRVKDASEGISQGIARISKMAEFDRLERYVSVLERAAAAMTVLAELEASGRLERIATAIK